MVRKRILNSSKAPAASSDVSLLQEQSEGEDINSKETLNQNDRLPKFWNLSSSCLICFFLLYTLAMCTMIGIFVNLCNVSHTKQVKSNNYMSEDVMSIFSKYDIDDNMNIDPVEFLPLSKVLSSLNIKKGTGTSTGITFESTSAKFDPKVDEVVRLQANMQPLILATMSQVKKDPDFGTSKFDYSAEFSGLLNWKKVNILEQELYAKEFKIFMPPQEKAASGHVYWIIPKPDDIEELTSRRYDFPPPKTEAEMFVHKLLRMFHPHPFVIMRFSPQGGVAMVTAQNNIYMEIHFRLHCEFQLNKFPQLPFWFTPAQFAGRIVIAKDGSHVRNFSLHVPNNVKLNVDMEWEIDSMEDNDTNMEVDIGYMPKMMITQLAPSSPAILINQDGTSFDRRELWKNGKDIHLEYDEIVWNEAISTEAAKRMIAMEFYPFKKVEYLPFSDAFDRAAKEEKLIHQVVLWGALDDQSC